MVDFLGSLGSANPWALYPHDSGALYGFYITTTTASIPASSDLDILAFTSIVNHGTAIQHFLEKTLRTQHIVYFSLGLMFWRERGRGTRITQSRLSFEKTRKRQTHVDVVLTFWRNTGSDRPIMTQPPVLVPQRRVEVCWKKERVQHLQGLYTPSHHQRRPTKP